jgi:hypothetical protein
MKYVIHIAKATKSKVEIIHEIDVNMGSSASMISRVSMGILSMLEDEAKVKLAQVQEQ